jgi:cysteine desulfurase
MKRIYFDHSASTPVDADVLKKMLPFFSTHFGNASSVHSFGQQAHKAVDEARQSAADFLNCGPDEIVFTSGATEANNLAVSGVMKAMRRRYKNDKLHVITSVIEHDSILEPFAGLERDGIEVSHVPVKPNGVIDPEVLRGMIKPETVLVSIMYVNSEVGSIQPIRDVGKIIRKINEKKLRDWQRADTKKRGEKPRSILFHTDATQAVNFLDCNVKNNFLDMLSLSGHKIYGPKGIGLLYVKSGAPIAAMQLGGHHEGNRRSGTLNTPGIVGLGAALAKLTPKATAADNRKISRLRDSLITGITKKIPDVILNTDQSIATPAHAHFSFLGVEGESILIALDLEGIAVSTGSACASQSLKASHVLVAMGIKVEIAHNSIRFSLGKHNTPDDIKKILAVLPAIVKRLRRISTEYDK